MKSKILSQIILFSIILASSIKLNAQADTARWQWMHSIGGLGPGFNGQQDKLTDFRIDQEGNSYLSGWFYNNLDIQNTHLKVPPKIFNNYDAINGFLVKLNCNGNVEWSSRWGSADGGTISSVLPYKDVVYAIGGAGTTAGYDLSIDDTIFSSGINDNVKIIVCKYDNNGNLLWISNLASRYLYINAHNGCSTVDEEGNIIILGMANNPNNNFNSYQGVNISNGYFLLKIDSNANYLDHQILADSFSIFSNFNFLELDEQGNVYIGGLLDSAMHNFSGVSPDYGQGRSVAFLAKYDSNFNLLWFEQSENIGNVTGNTFYGAAIDDNNNVYTSNAATNLLLVNGAYRGTSFQGDTVKNYYGVLNSNYKFIINKYDENGNLLWLKQVNSFRTDYNSKLDLYLSKDTIVAFGLIGHGAFSIDTFSTTLATTSIMLLKLDTLGSLIDIDFFPVVNGSDYILYGAQLSSNNNIYLAGTHTNYIQFPDSTLYPIHGAGSNQDIFIAKYGVDQCFRCDSVSIAFEVEQNLGYSAVVTNNTSLNATSYFWDFGNGQTSTDSLPVLSINYQDTGIYTICLTAQNFCDSQVFCQQIHITCPLPFANGFTYATGTNSLEIQSQDLQQYDSFTWYFGDGSNSSDSLAFHQYAQSGNYTVCLEAVNSCGVDSFCQNVSINCPEPIIISASIEQDSLYLGVANVNILNYDSVYWDFGNGAGSFDLFAEYNYDAPGIYNLCLEVFNLCGDTTFCQEINVVSTGIIKLANGSQINIFPNPSSQFIQLELDLFTSPFTIELFDSSGKRVLKDKLNNLSKLIDIQNLANGIYFLQLSNKVENYNTLIIKQ